MNSFIVLYYEIVLLKWTFESGNEDDKSIFSRGRGHYAGGDPAQY